MTRVFGLLWILACFYFFLGGRGERGGGLAINVIFHSCEKRKEKKKKKRKRKKSEFPRLLRTESSCSFFGGLRDFSPDLSFGKETQNILILGKVGRNVKN